MDTSWIRCSKRPKTIPLKNASRKEVLRTIHHSAYRIHPGLRVCFTKAIEEYNPLGRLNNDMLALISTYLFESNLLLELLQTGRIHRPFLVAMARFSCHQRRIEIRGGRCMTTNLSCHRHFCKWRTGTHHNCITWGHNYTQGRFLNNVLTTKKLPKKCWDGYIYSRDQNKEIHFSQWIIDQVQQRHKRALRN